MPFETRTLRTLCRVMSVDEKLDLVRMMISSESEGKFLIDIIAAEPSIKASVVNRHQAEVRAMFDHEDAHPLGKGLFSA